MLAKNPTTRSRCSIQWKITFINKTITIDTAHAMHVTSQRNNSTAVHLQVARKLFECEPKIAHRLYIEWDVQETVGWLVSEQCTATEHTFLKKMTKKTDLPCNNVTCVFVFRSNEFKINVFANLLFSCNFFVSLNLVCTMHKFKAISLCHNG